MRRLLGPPALILIAGVSLWLQTNKPADPGTAAAHPAPSTEAPPPALRAETATPRPPRPLPTRTVPISPDLTASVPAMQPQRPARGARAAGYERAATAFLTDFARPPATTTDARWWAKVVPHLSERAVADYLGTDPQQVAFSKLTGPAEVVPSDGPADLLTAVEVPTDAGLYRVEFETDEAGRHVTRVAPVQTASQ